MFEPEVLDPLNAGRTAVNGHIKSLELRSGEASRAYMVKESAMLERLCAGVEMDIAWMVCLTGNVGVDAIIKMVRDALPNGDTRTYDMKVALEQLNKIKEQRIWNYVGISGHQKVTAVVEILNNFLHDISPDTRDLTGSFLTKVEQQLRFFITFKEQNTAPANGADVSRVIYGDKALAACKGFMEAVTEDTPVNFEPLQTLFQFAYLLTPDEKKMLEEKRDIMTVTFQKNASTAGTVGGAGGKAPVDVGGASGSGGAGSSSSSSGSGGGAPMAIGSALVQIAVKGSKRKSILQLGSVAKKGEKKSKGS